MIANLIKSKLQQKLNVLIVDDVKEDRDLIKLILREDFADDIIVKEIDSVDTATPDKIKDTHIVFLDVMLPNKRGMRAYESGFEVLKKVKKVDADIQVLMMSSTKIDAGTAVIALTEMDVFYYFVKSDMTTEKVKRVFNKAVEYFVLKKENKQLLGTASYYRKEFFVESGLNAIIGVSDDIIEIKQNIKQIAPSDSNIVIAGPSGVGKELVAKAVHQLSKRHDKPFVKVDCTTIPKSLWHAHIFGSRKGAYTGLDENRAGFLKEADNGTIFFDEIAEIDTEVQSSLLRVIEEQKYRPLGEKADVKSDVRIVAATNKNLEDETQKGNFRKDLFFRLSVVQITLPPLAERKEDIALITEHLLKQEMKKQRKRINGISKNGLNLLTKYDWPGNIRELRNVIERCVIFCDEKDVIDDSLILKYGLPQYQNTQDYKIISLVKNMQRTKNEDDKNEIRETIKEKLIAALNKSNGNKTQASNLCGIGSRRTFYKYLKEFKVE